MNLNDIKLLFVLIKNMCSREMNRKMIGYSVREECRPISVKDIKLFADATLDNNITAYIRNGYVPPFFITRQLIPVLKKIMMHRDLKMNFLGLMHSRQEVIWHNQIKIGDKVIVEMRIADISEIAKGELISISVTGTVSNLKVLEGIINIIIKGKRKKDGKKENANSEKSKELFRMTFPTEKGQEIRYARASGDNNFIHTSNLIAKIAGLPGTIMHGSCVMAMTCNTLAASLIRNDMKRLAGMSVRFSYPVFPGEVLELIVFRGRNKNEAFFKVLNARGREVLKDGVFKYK